MTYSSSLAVSRQRFSSRNQNDTSFQVREKTLGPISNTILLIVLSCILGLIYLTQVTKTFSYSYKIRALSVQQTQLQQEQDNLQVASARLQALDRVANSQVNKKLVSVAPTDSVAN